MKQLIILPGGSTPRSERYWPVYDLLISTAIEKGWNANLIDFIGEGQSPEFGVGLELITNSISTRALLSQYKEQATLFCRCYGCYIGAYLLAFYPQCLSGFNHVIFWAPIPYWFQWKEAYAVRQSVTEFNLWAETRGYQLNQEFFKTLLPLEAMVTRIKTGNFTFSCGAADLFCTEQDVHYLARVMESSTGNRPRVVIVPGAKHGVEKEDSTEVKKQYLDMIFND